MAQACLLFWLLPEKCIKYFMYAHILDLKVEISFQLKYCSYSYVYSINFVKKAYLKLLTILTWNTFFKNTAFIDTAFQ